MATNQTSTSKTDRRVARTRALLRDALVALIQEKGYEQISVQNITDRANVNRATFYLHYKDKDELLLKSMKDVYDDLLARMGPFTLDDMGQGSRRMETITFEHVREYAGFYQVMLSDRGVAAFTAQILDYIAAVILKTCPVPQPGTVPPVPPEATAYYYAGAFVGLIIWWVKRGLPESVDTMVELLCQLDSHNADWAFGLPVTS
jgi:AcrR family transcriptional regulator